MSLKNISAWLGGNLLLRLLPETVVAGHNFAFSAARGTLSLNRSIHSIVNRFYDLYLQMQVKDVKTHKLDNRMESFFLAETLKYLYLLFDPDNFIHKDGAQAEIFNHPRGKCFLGAGGYIFNTEAHPIDIGALDCCSSAAELSKIENAFRTLSRRQDKLKWIQNYIKKDISSNGNGWSQRGLSSVINCTAQPFHAKMSIMGEMFPDIEWWVGPLSTKEL